MMYVKRIDLALAEQVIAAAEQCASAMGTPQNIAIVDESGHLIAFKRMDGAKFLAIDMAINKAFTASGSRKLTANLGTATVPGAPAFGIHTQHAGRFITVPGGFPLEFEGAVVGAVGVSSGSSAEDQAVGEAAVAAFLAAVASTGK